MWAGMKKYWSVKSRRIISQSTTLKWVHPHNRSIMFGRRPATCRSLMDSIPCSPVSMCVCVCAHVRSCVCVSVKSRTRNERTFILAFESTAPSVLTLADYKSDSHSCHGSFFLMSFSYSNRNKHGSNHQQQTLWTPRTSVIRNCIVFDLNWYLNSSWQAFKPD